MMTPRARRLTISGVALLAACGVALAVFLETRNPPSASGPVVSHGTADIGGPFTLQAAGGKTVTDKDFRGKWMLVYFGYTYCPDVCPTTLHDIAAALDKLGPLARRVDPVFITVDPRRDTAAVVGKYVKSFDPRIVGLSGTPAEIAAVTRAYHAYYKKIPNKQDPNDYLMDHSAMVYVMGPKGRYQGLFTAEKQPDQIAAQLRKLMRNVS
jgi:protein SCO1/2